MNTTSIRILFLSAIITATSAFGQASIFPIMPSAPGGSTVMTGTQEQTLLGQKVFFTGSGEKTNLVGISADALTPAAYVTNTASGPGLVVDCVGSGTAPALIIKTCAIVSGDNIYIVDPTGSVSMAGVIYSSNNNGVVSGTSINPNYRQLVGIDGMPRLTWSNAAVTINTVLSLPPRSAPTNPQRGDIYYDAALDAVRVYTNSGWKTITTN